MQWPIGGPRDETCSTGPRDRGGRCFARLIRPPVPESEPPRDAGTFPTRPENHQIPMKKNPNIYLVLAAAAVLTAFLVGRCTSTDHTSYPTTTSVDSDPAKIWTCSMHLHIRLPKPGSCPICGMDLIPVVEDGDLDDEAGPILTLSEAARSRAAIETRTVERGFPVREVHLVGNVEMDETRIRTLTARFPARLERLYLDYTGVRVQRGDHLADVYSPELLSAQGELLSALRFSGSDQMLSDAARRKMKLWGFSDDQIDAIVERGSADRGSSRLGGDRVVSRAGNSTEIEHCWP